MLIDPTNKAASVAQLLQKMEKHIEEVGWSESLFASSVGSSNALFKNLRKGSMPSVERLHAILVEMGEILVLGDPERYVDLLDISETEVDGHRFATVARYDVSAAAGGGFVNFDSPPIDHLAFSKTWLLQNGIQAGSCSLINAVGRSMEPSIQDGDLIMLDHRKSTIRNRKIYVYNDPENGTRVKRLEVHDNLIAVHSDNPDKDEFPSEYVTGEAMNAITQSIVGEVIWSGHKWV